MQLQSGDVQDCELPQIKHNKMREKREAFRALSHGGRERANTSGN